MIALVLAALIADGPLIFKWKDKDGKLHLTDRIELVPADLRAKYEKKLEEQKKQPKKEVKAAPPAPSAGDSAYERYKQRAKAEREIKERASELRTQIGTARETQAKLAEEKGYLQSNPVLNAAQPARVQRMNDIDSENKSLDKAANAALDELGELVERTQQEGFPEEWVTGVE